MSERPRPVDEVWALFEAKVVPQEAGDIQRSEMKKTFYAGAIALFGTITNRLEPGEEPTDNDLRFMQDIKDNIDVFIEGAQEEASAEETEAKRKSMRREQRLVHNWEAHFSEERDKVLIRFQGEEDELLCFMATDKEGLGALIRQLQEIAETMAPSEGE